LKINRNTIDLYYNHFRNLIFQQSFKENSRDFGIFELDESYFGVKRVRGKRGRGAAGKTPVFGLLKREGKVFVSIVPNCSREELMPIISGKILEGSTVHADVRKAYDGPAVNGCDQYRFHSHNEFARGKSRVNGIEAFWSFAKRRLAKFNGLKNEKFLLHLKECEFRYNNMGENLFKILTKLVNKNKKILV
jgi:transposase-like protein